jgi:tyrosine-protein kinase Etk/Wzc
LLDILIVLAKHKKLVLGLPFLAAVIAAGITLLMPNWYTATAKLLPPQQSQSNALAILGQLGALSGGASSALGIKNPSDIFVAMLKSRTVADALAERFNLKDLYNTQFVQDARKALAGNTNIVAGRDGVITIEVDDKSPQRAAD